MSASFSRLALLGVGVALLVLVVLEWRLLAAGAVAAGALRVMAHRAGMIRRRRRPRASWAKNLEAVSLAYAAWNTRHLGPPRRTLRGELVALRRRMSSTPCVGCGTTTKQHADTCPNQWDDIEPPEELAP